MTRIFVYEGREFPDPDPELTPEQIRQHWSTMFPELATATIKESKKGEDDVFTFERKVGTKG